MTTIKQKATAFLMSRIGKMATVASVSTDGHYLTRVQMHIPWLKQWGSTQHFKFEVAPYTYRDYSIAAWDPVARNATLLIDTDHAGPGSEWALSLQPGQEVHCAGPGGGVITPAKEGALICIGDASAAGHFCSLRHFAAHHQPFHCLLQLPGPRTATIIEGMPVQPITCNRERYLTEIQEWLYYFEAQPENTTYYVAGHTTMVTEVRRLLRQQGGRVKAAGFWS